MDTLQSMSTKKRSKKSKKVYFGPEVDQAIIKYNNSVDPMERSKIYNDGIRHALEKLVENTIHTYKFYYTDNQSIDYVQHEAVCFLVEKLYKYSEEKGKGFSYFSIVAKNYFILKNKKNYKKLLDHDSLDVNADSGFKDTSEDSPSLDLEKFFELYIKYWDTNLETVFPKQSDQLIADAIINLFRNRENIEIFNKKALYYYVRERTHTDNQLLITRMVKTLKDKYKAMLSDYITHGSINMTKRY